MTYILSLDMLVPVLRPYLTVGDSSCPAKILVLVDTVISPC